MKPTLNEKFLAYLALFSGLFLSLVAEYYSILGLTAIFSAAVIPVVIMGIALGLGKVTATLWLKQNWNIAPWTMRGYLFTAIIVLMIVTSIGIFGFLSKAHSDQNLVSGDVQSKIAIYDEKIKIAKENIDANRKALKQMDEAVDQVMGRSTSETGADKAVSIRRSQAKERARLQAEIAAEQKTIAELNEVRAPISAEVRKVEAEVGPIKYIAAFVYGDNPDANVLERAVTWVIIILIVVFDPLAVILLLSSQISFQNFRERETPQFSEWSEDDFEEIISNDAWVADVGEKPTAEELVEGDSPEKESDVVSTATVTEPINCYKCGTELVDAPGIGPFCPNKECDILDGPQEPVEESILAQHPYLSKPFVHFTDLKPMVARIDNYQQVQDNVAEVERPGDYITPPEEPGLFVQNEEQQQSNLWTSTVGSITHEEYLQSSRKKLEGYIDEVAALIVSGDLKITDIPLVLQQEVKIRMEHNARKANLNNPT